MTATRIMFEDVPPTSDALYHPIVKTITQSDSSLDRIWQQCGKLRKPLEGIESEQKYWSPYGCEMRPGACDDRKPERQHLAIHERHCPQTPHHRCHFPSLLHLQSLPLANWSFTLPSALRGTFARPRTLMLSSFNQHPASKSLIARKCWQFRILDSGDQPNENKMYEAA